MRVEAPKQWGVLTERRFWTADGREVDFGVAPPTWAGVAGGLQIVYDPDGLLASLISPG